MCSAQTTVTPNLIITGLMGSGKTTVGRLVADRLQCNFVDTDEFIEKQYGPTSAIFAKADGDEQFRLLEQQVAEELAARHSLVIATGGRFLLSQSNIDSLLQSGKVISLYAELPELVDRLRKATNKTFRPRFSNARDKLRLMQMLQQKSDPFLSQFDCIDTTGVSAHDVAIKVCEWFKR